MTQYSVYADFTVPAHITLLEIKTARTIKDMFLLLRNSRQECENYINMISNDGRFSNIHIVEEKY